ncbi:hypothetical protein QWY97_05430 [Vibrio cortegadensis]|uniref:hypothetical protein n=1 Tax=Vibrio cortegadensis TaxID=1328770 RepID=UPI0021C2D46D|nr:hypothetical protein [Vibrio cortegadensis]MDN3696792.1 hypothetical protein [Vibrio cortegadensis]
MKTFLKKKSIPFEGDNIEITQLSGLERFDFLDYCSDLEKPTQPKQPAEDATEQEFEQYYEAMEKCLKKWSRVNFIGQSRLVAYGYQISDIELEERHQMVMSSMTPELVKLLHDEIAVFSGIPLPKEAEETSEPDHADAEQSEEQLEPVDPKG